MSGFLIVRRVANGAIASLLDYIYEHAHKEKFFSLEVNYIY